MGSDPTLQHPGWVEVDLKALVHNASVVRRAIPADARLGLAVKANGYGHGLEMAARAAVVAGADLLAVATVDEGLAIRRTGVETPILVVYPIPADAVGEAVNAGLEMTVSGLESARQILTAWAALSRQSQPRGLTVHVEVDTGMGRGGVAAGALLEAIRLLDTAPATRIAGIWSHLADGRDVERSGVQTRRFDAAVDDLVAAGRSIPERHLATTEAVFAATARAYEMVRVGLAFYGELGIGFEPSPALASLAAELRPAMAIKARPVRLEMLPAGASVGYGREWTAARPSLIATLPVGYADGWTRAYWPGAWALLRGRRVPLVGRVSMDAVCADLTDVMEMGAVTLDEELVLLGGQGTDRITANELAHVRGSIPNEVLASLGARLPRVYLDERVVVATSHQADRVDRVPGASW